VSTQLGSAGQNRWPQLAGEVLRMAFWGVCGALAVVAVAMVQQAPQVRAAAEQQQAAEIAAENSAYCEKWGMRAGTREQVICTLDLDEIRARQAKRLAAGIQGLI
jgi:putative hemolysin